MRYAGWLKYSDGFALVDDGESDLDRGSELEGAMRKVSPAPSQSLEVIMGVCT